VHICPNDHQVREALSSVIGEIANAAGAPVAGRAHVAAAAAVVRVVRGVRSQPSSMKPLQSAKPDAQTPIVQAPVTQSCSDTLVRAGHALQPPQ